jgi:hypothetical protein
MSEDAQKHIATILSAQAEINRIVNTVSGTHGPIVSNLRKTMPNPCQTVSTPGSSGSTATATSSAPQQQRTWAALLGFNNNKADESVNVLGKNISNMIQLYTIKVFDPGFNIFISEIKNKANITVSTNLDNNVKRNGLIQIINRVAKQLYPNQSYNLSVLGDSINTSTFIKNATEITQRLIDELNKREIKPSPDEIGGGSAPIPPTSPDDATVISKIQTATSKQELINIDSSSKSMAISAAYDKKMEEFIDRDTKVALDGINKATKPENIDAIVSELYYNYSNKRPITSIDDAAAARKMALSATSAPPSTSNAATGSGSSQQLHQDEEKSVLKIVGKYMNNDALKKEADNITEDDIIQIRSYLVQTDPLILKGKKRDEIKNEEYKKALHLYKGLLEKLKNTKKNTTIATNFNAFIKKHGDTLSDIKLVEKIRSPKSGGRRRTRRSAHRKSKRRQTKRA